MEIQATINRYLCSIALILPFLALLYERRRRNAHAAGNRSTAPPPQLPPGPTGWPIVGCLPEFIMRKKNKQPMFRWIHKLVQDSGKEIACFRFGNVHVVPVVSPELAREFLRKHDAVFSSRPDCMSARLTGNGNLHAVALAPAGDHWRKMRRVLVSLTISPAMHHRFHEEIHAEADHLVRYVYRQCQDSNKLALVNVRVAAQHYCANVIRKVVFGKRFFGAGAEDGGPGIKEREHVDGVFELLSSLYSLAIGDFVPWLQALDLDGCERVLTEATNSVNKYHDPEISGRVEMWRQGIRKTEEDILDVLINLKDSENNNGPLLSVEEIRAEIVELMMAGTDNPSHAVEWALAEMINQRHILQKARAELDRVVGRNRLVEESDVPKLSYLAACIKESFRLHPVAPFNLPHLSTEDAVVGGYFIPKGSYVLISRFGLGRNSRVWEDSLKYNPERHIVDETSEVVRADHELRFVSFGIGRRGCPSVVLGTTLVTIPLARLIQGFNWAAPPDHGPNVDLAESEGNTQLAEPLIAQATPRPEQEAYMQLLSHVN